MVDGNSIEGLLVFLKFRVVLGMLSFMFASLECI
jgi:hypothetical protein